MFPVGGRKYYQVMTSSAEIQDGGSRPEVVVLVFQSTVGVVVMLHKNSWLGNYSDKRFRWWVIK